MVDRLTDLTYLIKKGPHDKGVIAHVDKLKQCGDIPSCHNVSVNSFVLTGGMEQQRLPNQCNQCQNAFTRPAGLRQHRESVHLNIA